MTIKKYVAKKKKEKEKKKKKCPPEDQAEVIHAISPISVKLGQIEGLPNNSKRQNGFTIAIFRGELDHPPAFFA